MTRSNKRPPASRLVPKKVLQTLADLARVRDENRKFFIDEVRMHVRDAHELDALGKGALATRTGEGIRRSALALYEAVGNLKTDERKLIERMLRGRGRFIFNKLSDRGLSSLFETTYQLAFLFSLVTGNPQPPSPNAARAVRNRGRSPGGRRPGSIKNVAFLMFVQGLRISANTAGGKLTLDKTNPPRGSLFPALEMLAPYLPSGFVPRSPAASTLRKLFDQISAAEKDVRELDPNSSTDTA